jgi:histidinol-phosphate aminotransferase
MAFLRDDLALLAAYQSPHPADESAADPAHLDPRLGLDTPVLDALDTNESPIDLPPELKAALAEQYREAIAANRYPDSDPLALKQAVMRYAISSAQSNAAAKTAHTPLASEPITPEHITLGNGSDELIRSVIMATCLGNHGSILVAAPTFSMYSILAKTLGVEVHTVGRSGTFEVDLAAADAAIAEALVSGPPVRTVFMVHPNSPTGNALTQRELSWLKQLPTDILVVVDEAYFEFSGHTTLAEALSRPNWLVTRTFSKAFRLAAHRVGYGIAHPSIIAALEKLRLPYNLPSFSQAAAHTALAYSELLLAQISTILGERDRLHQALSAHPDLQVWPSNSNFLYIRLFKASDSPENSSENGLAQLFEQLKAKGTLVRHTGGGLRVSIGTATENQRTLTHFQQALTSSRH